MTLATPLHRWLTLVLLLSCTITAPAQHGVAHNTVWEPAPGHAQAAIWPGAAPDLLPAKGPEVAEPVSDPKEFVAGRPWLSVEQVSRPTLTVYSPHGRNTGAAIVVYPGGGYSVLAIDLEGTEVCDWVVSQAMTCILLKYRVPDSGPAYHDDCHCNIHPQAPTALQDAQRTMGLVRLHAKEWKIDPHRVGVLGFSAGGHLVANLSTHFDHRAYTRVDAADDLSCRPDFAIAIYPVHLREHTTKDFDLNPEIPVTANTPPTFLLQAEDDNVDGVKQALVYYIALKAAGVAVEMHLYAHGGHAFGLRPTKFPITHWPQLVDTWLRTTGVLSQ